MITLQAWALLLGTLGIWTWLALFDSSYRTGYFFAYRSLTLLSGVSPAVPLLLLIIASFCWAWVQLKRETQFRQRKLSTRGDLKAADTENVHRDNVDRSLTDIFSIDIWMGALPFLVAWLLLLSPMLTVRSFEHKIYDWLYWIILAEVYWMLSVSWMQFIRCWQRLKGFLEWLENQPFRNAFSRISSEEVGISWVPLVVKPREHFLFISTRWLNSIEKLMAFDPSTLSGFRATQCSRLLQSLSEPSRKIRLGLVTIERNAALGNSFQPAYAELQEAFVGATDAIARDLRPIWDSDGPAKAIDSDSPRENLGPEEKLRAIEEEVVALRYLMFLRYVFRQLRNLLGFIVAAFVLSVLSLSSYPFEAHRWIVFSSLIVLVVLGIGIATVFAQMDRDAILSRLTNTKANELNKTFYLRTLQFGALPLVTLLASLFPSVNHYVFSWAQPALQALR